MTTQSKLSNSIEGAPASVVKPHFSWPLALAILVVGMMLGVFAANLPLVSGKTGAPERIVRYFPARPNLINLEKKALMANEAQVERALEAEAARYTSLGMFYTAGNEANVQRAIAAQVARYNGLAAFYAGESEISGQRGLEAEAARYNGLATLYAGENEMSEQRGLEAEAARYSGMAKLYLSENLAWPPRPAQFYPVEKPGESIAGNEAKTESDIGLMEFFSGINRREQTVHDREYGFVKFFTN